MYYQTCIAGYVELVMGLLGNWINRYDVKKTTLCTEIIDKKIIIIFLGGQMPRKTTLDIHSDIMT